VAESIAEFEKVVFSYDRAEVLHEISFTLNRGEVVGLLGPNGAGKSTTIKIICGILAAASGRVSVCGLPMPEGSVDVKQRIGYVPEAAVLFDSLTGQEFLELSGRLHDVEEATLQDRIRDILETFSLSGDRYSRLDKYSKGMRQKILIAAALLHNPDSAGGEHRRGCRRMAAHTEFADGLCGVHALSPESRVAGDRGYLQRDRLTRWPTARGRSAPAR